MSKATEMAGYCGAIFDEEAKLFVFDEEELIDFYHAARAEALREASACCEGLASGFYDHAKPPYLDCAERLRAMADREGKE